MVKQFEQFVTLRLRLKPRRSNVQRDRTKGVICPFGLYVGFIQSDGYSTNTSTSSILSASVTPFASATAVQPALQRNPLADLGAVTIEKSFNIENIVVENAANSPPGGYGSSVRLKANGGSTASLLVGS